MFNLKEDMNNLCLTNDSEPIFTKRQIFKNFHFLIRKHLELHV